ncbi:MAG: xylose isomerase [Lentisphaerae bacterium RIFOXYB12_FULL_65_16]|nr:MAG: xylose isomerase [Lentisphaerae bacterium RIFOXYA12_64_32]OGV93373.1 MAG: xylose isomerase [Lentisphaerae bacterium RIFOXYB12_FULL_65_16]
MIKLGVNSVLFAGLDFAAAAKTIKACGYDGIEVSAISGMCEHLVLDRWQEQGEEVRRIAADNGLALLSMEVASLDSARLEKAFAAGKALGIPIINVGPGGKSDIEEDLVRQIGVIAAAAERAAAYGVTLCCKAHVGGSIYSTPTTLRAMAKIACPAFGVDMDPSHIYRAGELPEKALPAVIGRVKHIHIRDCKGKGPSPGDARDQACGRGEINLAGYCKAMVDGKYDGPVCLEVIGAGKYDLAERAIIAAESYGYLNACLKALGAR